MRPPFAKAVCLQLVQSCSQLPKATAKVVTIRSHQLLRSHPLLTKLNRHNRKRQMGKAFKSLCPDGPKIFWRSSLEAPRTLIRGAQSFFRTWKCQLLIYADDSILIKFQQLGITARPGLKRTMESSGPPWIAS